MKVFTTTALVCVAVLLSACGSPTGNSGSVNDYLMVDEGMTVAQAEAIVGTFDSAKPLNGGVVCHTKAFSPDPSQDDRVLNVYFQNGKMFAQRISDEVCNDGYGG